MANGPIFSGIPSIPEDVIAGQTYRPFAALAIADASSQQISLTVTLSDIGAGALVDPNAASDGSSYNAATGVFTISGSVAAVAAALRALEFVVPAHLTAGGVEFNINATDGASLAGGADLAFFFDASTSYSGGGNAIALSGNPSTVGLVLTGTNGVADVVSGPISTTAVAWLDDAQATFDVEAILHVSAGDSATLAYNAWNAAYGDDAAFTLAGADLTVYGNHAEVAFRPGTDDTVSFFGPGVGFFETVTGSDGVVVENGVEVSLTGDGDIVYFEGGGNVLDLTAATAGAWNVLYASGGEVNLMGASLSVVGGGVTVNAVSGDDPVSLYGTGGPGFTVNGSGLTVTLNGSTEATINGGDDSVWFENGSGSTATLDPTLTTPDTVYGAGTVELASGAVNAVGGGAQIVLKQKGEVVGVSFTNGFWDRVEDAPGIIGGRVNIANGQAAIYGGNMIVDFTDPTGAVDSASLNATGGNWDSVYGTAASLIVNDAEVNLYGDISTVYLYGTGTQVSVYVNYTETNLIGSDQTVTLNTYTNDTLTGGANILYMEGGDSFTSATIAGTGGAWDVVYAQDANLDMTDAQASVLGGGNSLNFETSGEQVSLDDTGGDDNTISGGYGAVSLTDASCVFYYGDYFIYSGGGANMADLTYSSNNALVLRGAFGDLTVIGFNSSDLLILSKSQFADFQAFENALTTSGADEVLTLDANDKVTFSQFSGSAISAAQVSFV